MTNHGVETALEATTADELHFLNEPEVIDAFERMLDEFSQETDRGAVLVASDIVNAQLGKAIQELAPFKPAYVKNLLNYPGQLSTFAGRADMAFMAGYISEAAHRSVDLLRGMRNKAAHSQESFRLSEYRNKLREMCNFGPGTAAEINRSAVTAVVQSFISRVMAGGDDLVAKIGRNPFATPRDVIDHLAGRPDLIASLEDRLPRMELAFGVWVLLGLIADHRKRLVAQRASPSR